MAKKPIQVRFPKPKNSNNKLSNKHCFYVATSECGKTSAIKNMPKETRMKKTDSYIMFDPFEDYVGVFKGMPVTHFDNLNDFYRALCFARNSSKPYRIAYTPIIPTAVDFNRWCGVVWSIGDGNNPVHVIIEEVAQFVSSSGSATGYLNNLISVGRKFGFMISFAFQRGQEVPNTIIGGCAYKWIGIQERADDGRYLASATGIPFDEIDALIKLDTTKEVSMTYVFKKPGPRTNYEKGIIRFKK